MWTAEDYYYYDQYLATQPIKTTPVKTTPAKTTFWETGFGKGLTSLWTFGTNNPDQIISLVNKNKNIDPLSPSFQGGYTTGSNGYVGGSTGTNGNTPTPTNNNTTILAIMGVGVVIVLFLLFKNK